MIVLFKMIDKLFYVLLSYYSRKTDHKIDTPMITVFFIFTFLTASLLLVLNMTFAYMQNIERRGIVISKPIGYLMLLISALITYFSFVYKKRYVTIYKTYRSYPFLNEKGGRRLYWFVTLMIILSPYILALAMNKIVHGYWY